MADQELVSYIREQLETESEDEIRKNLEAVGWDKASIDTAFSEARGESGGEAKAPTPPPQEETSKKDFTSLQVQKAEPTDSGGPAKETSGAKAKKLPIVPILIGIGVLVLAAAGYFAYAQDYFKVLPFISGGAPFAAEEFNERALDYLEEDHIFSSEVKFSFETGPREEGAEPFEFVYNTTPLGGSRPHVWAWSAIGNLLLKIDEYLVLDAFSHADTEVPVSSKGINHKKLLESGSGSTRTAGIVSTGAAVNEDYTSEIDFEWIQDGQSLYVRLNKYSDDPPLYFGFLDPFELKGKWVKLNEDDLDGLTMDSFAKGTKALFEEDKLFTVTNGPIAEERDEETLYRYDLALREETLIPFLNKIFSLKTNTILGGVLPLIIELLVEETNQIVTDFGENEKSDKFFEYLREHAGYSVWYDAEGLPRESRLWYRHIPPAYKYAELSNRQAVFEISEKTTEIEKAGITVPDEFLTLEEAFEISTSVLPEETRHEVSDANIKANLNNLRAQAELYYDQNDNSYGDFYDIGACPTVEGEHRSFAAEGAGFAALDTVRDITQEPYCAVSSGSWAIAAPLVAEEGKFYCVDSSGYARTERFADASEAISGTGSPNDSFKCREALLDN